MDSFHEPYTRAGDDISLDAVREQVRALEETHKAHGVQLSGRIVHVCHSLPVVPSLIARTSPAAAGVLSPPPSPPTQYGDVPPSPTGDAAQAEQSQQPSVTSKRWKLAPRYGHAAMISGIRSLSATYDQLIVGWTGDIVSLPSVGTASAEDNSGSSDDGEHRIPSHLVSRADREALEAELVGYDEDGQGQGIEGNKGKLEYVPVWLEDKVAHGHYEGYCKTTLWPLFHYLLWQDVATEYASADAHWVHYERANQVFAERIASVLKPGDLVWVHDYHLLLVPKLLRSITGEKGTDAIIGLFVHTPFPSSEVFRCLPRRKEILEGMLGANLVCFQTYSYSRHFTSTCVRVRGYETTTRSVSASTSSNTTSTLSTSAHPVSAQPDRTKSSNSSDNKFIAIDVQGHTVAVSHCPLEALRTLYADKKIIVGRDKLDVVKGVLQKVCHYLGDEICPARIRRADSACVMQLRAFEKLLHDYPQWQGQVVLIQVTSPALTDSPKLERQVSELVAHINGEYGSLDFIPVHHYHQSLKKDEFYALLSVADLGVITPLRDGMNTTSMEFVIAQERTKRSPLVLSEFMGISQHMDQALQVNPWDLGDVAAAMNSGLLMSSTSKAARHATLHKVVTTHTSHTWAALLVKMLLSQINGQTSTRGTPYLSKELIRDKYEKAGKRLFLFDYDGTLTPIVKTPSMATPSSDALKALTKLAADSRNVVYIVSGRDQAFLEQHLGHIKHLGMSAEHGGFIREPSNGNAARNLATEDEETWVNFTAQLDMGWMDEVAEIFRYYTERTTGSHIEVKKSSITWHYRASDPEWGLFQCRQCQDLLENNLAHKRPIEVLVGKKNLEVRPLAVNKGEIVKRILYMNPDAEFIFCAGDDKTDEDMFRALHVFPSNATGNVQFEAPLSITLVDNNGTTRPDVELAIASDAIFTTSVGPSTKRTLASWHVTMPLEVVDHMLHLVGETSRGTIPAGSETAGNSNGEEAKS
ncbi:glycosyltransferase family 20 protein [Butyriboletus roseoflavus]|nr:glycosyltransferase family 20 protein [Butyriboletus roseoflavus]